MKGGKCEQNIFKNGIFSNILKNAHFGYMLLPKFCTFVLYFDEFVSFSVKPTILTSFVPAYDEKKYFGQLRPTVTHMIQIY